MQTANDARLPYVMFQMNQITHKTKKNAPRLKSPNLPMRDREDFSRATTERGGRDMDPFCTSAVRRGKHTLLLTVRPITSLARSLAGSLWQSVPRFLDSIIST